MQDYVNKYLTHIEHDRNFSSQTRAYRNDLYQYLEFLKEEGCCDLGNVSRLLLRRFLAFQKNRIILKPQLPENLWLLGRFINFYAERDFRIQPCGEYSNS